MQDDSRFSQAADAFAALVKTMARLRAPGGCPWDREQTLETLKPYLIEEAYEVLDTMGSGQGAEHCEELGDLLLQVVFQAEIAHEAGGFDVAQVARGINDKLVRRHPHIFADAVAPTAHDVMKNWETIKAAERGPGKSRLTGVPRALPALLRASRVNDKAAAAGFDWPDTQSCQAKVQEEWQEFAEAQAAGDHAAMVDEMGDVLMSLVSLCRHLRIDPEAAMTQAIEKFISRFQYVETALQQNGETFEAASLDRLNELWEEKKRKTQHASTSTCG